MDFGMVPRLKTARFKIDKSKMNNRDKTYQKRSHLTSSSKMEFVQIKKKINVNYIMEVNQCVPNKSNNHTKIIRSRVILQ
jgi:hypothetical protein